MRMGSIVTRDRPLIMARHDIVLARAPSETRPKLQWEAYWATKSSAKCGVSVLGLWVILCVHITPLFLLGHSAALFR